MIKVYVKIHEHTLCKWKCVGSINIRFHNRGVHNASAIFHCRSQISFTFVCPKNGRKQIMNYKFLCQKNICLRYNNKFWEDSMGKRAFHANGGSISVTFWSRKEYYVLAKGCYVGSIRIWSEKYSTRMNFDPDHSKGSCMHYMTNGLGSYPGPIWLISINRSARFFVWWHLKTLRHRTQVWLSAFLFQAGNEDGWKS